MAEYHQIGKYVLLRELPETPLGRNFRAAELGTTGLNRIVHLTRLINEIAPEAKFQTMLQGKYFGMGRVLHEGISKGYEVNNIGGIFLSQEFVQGFSIKAIIKRCVKNNLPFSLDYALYTASKICNALEYAHGQMIGTDPLIHGGLTPYNVFLTFDGDVKIQDWSVVACADYMANARNIFLQRFQLYLAPEQIEGRPATQSVDIFQTGLIFYEMITGSPLFTINRQENVQQMVEELYSHQRVFDGKTPPPEMLTVVAKALSINPATRYPSIRAMREELDTLLYSGIYLATATKTSFFINSIYKEEIKNLKVNLESEYNINYAPYLTVASTPQPQASQNITGPVEELSAEEISAQILPDTGVIEVEDEGIETEVGDDFISYTRKKKNPLTTVLVGVAAVAVAVLLFWVIFGKKAPEVQTIDSPEDMARRAQIEKLQQEIEDKQAMIDKAAAESKAAADKMAALEAEKKTRDDATQKIVEEAARMKAIDDDRKRQEEAERLKKAADEKEEAERLARQAAELEKGTSSNQPSTNPSTTPASTTATPTSTPPRTTPTATTTTNTSTTSTSIQYISSDDVNLIMNPVYTPRPNYPKKLDRAGIRRSATVNLILYIDTDGTVERVAKLGGEEVFISEAQKACKTWRYSPPVLKNGQKVKVVKRVTVNF